MLEHAVGRRIRRVDVVDAGLVRGTSGGEFADALRGTSVP
jgi:hypothetical protein